MKHAIRVGLCLAGALVVGSLAGCTKYYEVRDPESSRVYYTTKLSDQRGGAMRFENAADGSTVTLQNSQVKEVSKSEFEQGSKPATPK